jgi:hypothetical protein
LVTVEVVLLGPLLVFTPTLIRTRLRALHDYSLLVGRHNRAFHAKWILEERSTDELVGTADVQSLADLGNSFEFIRGMRVVPFNQRVILQLAILTSLPCLPLMLLVVPMGEVFFLVTKAVF